MTGGVAAIRAVAALMLVCVLLASCGTLDRLHARSDYRDGLDLFNQGKYEEAIPSFRRVIANDAQFASAYLYLGRCYLSLGRFREAIQPLRTAMNLAPGLMKKEAFNLLTDALLAAGLPE